MREPNGGLDMVAEKVVVAAAHGELTVDNMDDELRRLCEGANSSVEHVCLVAAVQIERGEYPDIMIGSISPDLLVQLTLYALSPELTPV